MITVWGRRNSVNVQKVMWTLGELGVSYERKDVAGSFGVDEAYLAMNPQGTVPTIQDGELTLFESNACVRYLAREYGKGGLWPNDAATLAEADQWMDFQAAVLTPAFFQVFLNKIRLPPRQAKPAMIGEGVKRCAAVFSRLDRHLASRDYMTGDALTIGDISIGAHLYRYFTMDIERPALPNVEGWYERLRSRPAYQKHVMIPFGRDFESWNEAEKANAGIQ